MKMIFARWTRMIAIEQRQTRTGKVSRSKGRGSFRSSTWCVIRPSSVYSRTYVCMSRTTTYTRCVCSFTRVHIPCDSHYRALASKRGNILSLSLSLFFLSHPVSPAMEHVRVGRFLLRSVAVFRPRPRRERRIDGAETVRTIFP